MEESWPTDLSKRGNSSELLLEQQLPLYLLLRSCLSHSCIHTLHNMTLMHWTSNVGTWNYEIIDNAEEKHLTDEKCRGTKTLHNFLLEFKDFSFQVNKIATIRQKNRFQIIQLKLSFLSPILIFISSTSM